jgi:hypothetical protein
MVGMFFLKMKVDLSAPNQVAPLIAMGKPAGAEFVVTALT